MDSLGCESLGKMLRVVLHTSFDALLGSTYPSQVKWDFTHRKHVGLASSHFRCRRLLSPY